MFGLQVSNVLFYPVEDLMFYQNVDFNGNSANLMRLSNSFITQSYPFESHPVLNKGELPTCVGNSNLSSRKAKRSKSNAEKETYSKAEDVAGFCGNLEIDQLVEFINSSGNDKKKPPSKGGANLNTTGAAIAISNNNNNKYGSNVDCGEKRGKEPREKMIAAATLPKVKHVFKRKSGGVSSSGSSEEHNGPDMDMNDLRQQSVESDDGEVTPTRIQSPVSDGPSVKGEEMGQLHHGVPSSVQEKTLQPIDSADFVEDFYTVAEIGQVPVEESEFRVVVNKQRKKKQAKKSEPFRRYSNAGNGGDRSGTAASSSERDFYLHNQQCHSSGMIIYSGLRNQRGKPDPSRRKSTSSMPPSEPSSADNSDLDSVHSLPVVGSVPPNTGPHPHTTPSSMSSTPQASYADIARMASSGNFPIKKCDTNSPGEVAQDIILPKEDNKPKLVEATPAVPNYNEKPSVVNVSTSPMVSIPTGLAKPKPLNPEGIVKPTPIMTVVPVLPQERVENPEVEKPPEPMREISPDVNYSVMDKAEMDIPLNPCNPHPPEPLVSSTSSSGQLETPPVIQSDASSRVCDVSFGFDLSELMRLSEGYVPVTFDFEQSVSSSSSTPAGPVLVATRRNLQREADASSTRSSISDATTVDSVSLKTEAPEVSFSGAAETSHVGSGGGTSRTEPADGLSVSSPEISDNQSSPKDNVVVVSGGKRIHYKEPLDETLNFNHVQVVNFFGAAWNNTIQDYQKDGAAGISSRPENKRIARICYYNSSQC